MKDMITSKPVTSGQINGFANTVADATRKSTHEELNVLAAAGHLDSSTMQRVLASGERIATAVSETVKSILEEVVSGIVGVLKHISIGKSVVIGATNGTETLATATDVFNFVDPDFNNWGCDKPEKPTQDTSVEVYEQIENADYRKIFSSFGQNLDRLCLTTPQIKTFVRDHADNYLREDGWAVFLFLFKVRNAETGKDEFFVAYVDRRGGGYREADVSRLSSDGVWRAGRRDRVVVPQL